MGNSDINNFPNFEEGLNGDYSKNEYSRQAQADFLFKLIYFSKNLNVSFLRGKKLNEVFSSEENKRKFLDKTTPEEFISLSNGVNAILRKNEKEIKSSEINLKYINKQNDVSIGFFDGIFLWEIVYCPPAKKEDKIDLLKESFQIAKKMNKQGRNLADIGLLLKLGINYIHPYEDGNGRIGRLFNLMMIGDFDQKNFRDKIKLNLSEFGREEEQVDFSRLDKAVNHIVGKRIIRDDDSLDKLNVYIKYGHNFKLKNLNKSEITMIMDRDFLSLALINYFKKNNSLEKLKELNDKDNQDKIRELSSILDKEFKDNRPKIVEIYQELKKEVVRTVFDIVVNPDREEYQIDFDEEGVKKSIKSRYCE